ncbi:hypothetical protein [Collimonas humicola]|uniref:hypothetical protein n=1 Tax=Collimonas humicola TaxID=2825886 RepID=UPI001B8BF383|nr:hypothetical protein [Collimonas humicola]
MSLVTVCFDQVFDLAPGMLKRKEVTFFSFISNTTCQYAVPAPGRPKIQAGMIVTAYLWEDANWQTLVGWRDHSSNEVVIESKAYEMFFLVCLGLFVALILYAGPSIIYQCICFLGVALSAAWVLTSILRIRRIESILRNAKRL